MRFGYFIIEIAFNQHFGHGNREFKEMNDKIQFLSCYARQIK